LIAASIVTSTALADQPAAAAVTAASWIMLMAAGLLAGRLLSAESYMQTRLLRGLVLGTAAGIASTWALWLATVNTAILLYAHPRILGLHMLAGSIGSVALLLLPKTRHYVRAGEWMAGALTWGGLLWSGGRAPVLAAALAVIVWMICARPSNRLHLI